MLVATMFLRCLPIPPHDAVVDLHSVADPHIGVRFPHIRLIRAVLHAHRDFVRIGSRIAALFLRAESAKFTKIIVDANVKVEQ